MAESGIVVEGAEELKRTLGRLAVDLADLEPANRRAGDLLLTRAGPRTPRQSGRLAASGRVDADSTGTAVVYAAEYAGPIHNGWAEHNITPQPWLAETVEESTAAVTEVYIDHVEDLVHRVRGA